MIGVARNVCYNQGRFGLVSRGDIPVGECLLGDGTRMCQHVQRIGRGAMSDGRGRCAADERTWRDIGLVQRRGSDWIQDCEYSVRRAVSSTMRGDIRDIMRGKPDEGRSCVGYGKIQGIMEDRDGSKRE